MASTSSVFASGTVKVQGTVSVGACVPELSNGGVIGFDEINGGTLSANDTNVLPQKDLTVTINCQSATQVAFRTIDNRWGTLNDLPIPGGMYGGGTTTSNGSKFGLGKMTTGQKKNIGAYTFYVNHDVTLSGNPDNKTTGRSAFWDDGEDDSWYVGNAMPGESQGIRRYTVVDTSNNNEPMSFTTARFDLVITAVVDGTANLELVDEANFDGNATLSLEYL